MPFNFIFYLNFISYPMLFKEVWRMTGVPDTLIPSDPDIILWVSILSEMTQKLKSWYSCNIENVEIED